jgi:ribosome biogenesis GTPase / thiamine phosphate phosphatase
VPLSCTETKGDTITVFALETLGWDDAWAEQFAPHRDDGLVPGRVAVQHRGAWDVLTEDGELRVDLAGRLFHEAATAAELPVVGDWVAVATRQGGDAGTIQALLPRRTRFSRKTAWHATEEQVLAANLDVVFIVSSLNEDLNLRRLERYLILAWESGATPVVLLTKADLHPDPEAAVVEVATVAPGVDVHPLSARTGDGVAAIEPHLRQGVTSALLGSSGVGKSTLVNRLAGEELLATQAIREDGRGRHTTTRRELVLLPSGGLVIDTPGIRELQLWEADEGLEEAFEDVAELAARCKFSDCAHDTEPGCAIRAALEDGTLAPDRWDSYVKLQRELEHLERRLDKRAQSEQRRHWRAINIEQRRRQQAKGRPQ